MTDESKEPISAVVKSFVYQQSVVSRLLDVLSPCTVQDLHVRCVHESINQKFIKATKLRYRRSIQ